MPRTGGQDRGGDKEKASTLLQLHGTIGHPTFRYQMRALPPEGSGSATVHHGTPFTVGNHDHSSLV